MTPVGRRSVADVALPGGMTVEAQALPRSRALRRLRLGDALFRTVTRASTIAVLVILGGVIVALIPGSLPALQTFGLNFLVEGRWNPVTERFGSIAPIYGTLVTSLIAMVIAVPGCLLIA